MRYTSHHIKEIKENIIAIIKKNIFRVHNYYENSIVLEMNICVNVYHI